MDEVIRPKRFRVALSFPGEERDFVRQVAESLAGRIGRESVLYDDYYTSEFARPDLDTYLQNLYHKESDLIAVFLCAKYEEKDWCRLEWRVVRELIKKRNAAAVMPFRFDATEIPGLFSGDGYVWIPGRTPEQIADLILERLAANEQTDTVPSPAPSGGTGRVAPTRLTHVAEELFGREAEFARLDAAWANPNVRVVTFVAWGGVGKTSLVAKWAAAKDLGGADYFDWSFYSQGTREEGSASGEPFVNAALRFFGNEEGEKIAGSTTSAWDKGAKLAALVARRRTLLILDGLEPLQYPPSSPLAGQLKDPGVTALLKGLAQSNPGLCVVTTREEVTDLAAFHGGSALEWSLERLSKAAGVALLEKLQVRGNKKEMEKLVEDVDGHALTLSILGSYLRDALEGDIRRLDLVELDEADREERNGHAFRAIATYEKWLGEEKDAGARQLALLRLLGLFDRPADSGCLKALRQEPAIPGFTEPLVDLSDAQWNLNVSRLADRGLVSKEGTALDAHPLIREYFAKQLRNKSSEAWRAAHGRLFEHLRDSTPQLPDTLEGLQPLYQAVAHGCHAGRQQEACDDLYWNRITRGAEAFVVKKLGAFGTDLGAVACFFDPPWRRVSPALNEGDRAWLLNQAAFNLRALGRLTEALEAGRGRWSELSHLEHATQTTVLPALRPRGAPPRASPCPLP